MAENVNITYVEGVEGELSCTSSALTKGTMSFFEACSMISSHLFQKTLKAQYKLIVGAIPRQESKCVL